MILAFIRALADYEKMTDQVIATEELLKEWIFEKKKAERIWKSITERAGSDHRRARMWKAGMGMP